MSFNIADLKLSTSPAHYGLLASVSDDDSAMVGQGMAIAFVAGINVQNKNDVMDSTLLAQLAASAQYDRLTQTQQWYDFYKSVLENIGWIVESFKFDKHALSNTSISVNNIVLGYLRTYLEPYQLALIGRVIEALQNASDPSATIFSSASSSDHEANFQLGSCIQDKDNNLQFGIGAFSYTSSETITNCLVANIKSGSAEFFNSYQNMILNIGVYESLRSDVRTKLGKNGQDFIGNLKLPAKKQ